jgi:hypothetical protein
MTSRQPSKDHIDGKMKIIEIGGLKRKKMSAWYLFREFYEKTNESELMDLCKHIPKECELAYNEGVPQSEPHKMNENNVGDHHLFDLLGRHPLAIILAAKLHASFPQMTLVDLYTTLRQAKQDIEVI